MSLWIILAVLLAAVLVAVLWPLLRPRAVLANRADFDIEVYLDQLRELERDVTRELIDESQAVAAKLEIERRLLAASRSAENKASTTTSARRAPLAALLTVVITAASLALYLNLGSPGLPNQPFAQRPPPLAENPQVFGDLAEQPNREAFFEFVVEKNPTIGQLTGDQAKDTIEGLYAWYKKDQMAAGVHAAQARAKAEQDDARLKAGGAGGGGGSRSKPKSKHPDIDAILGD